MARKLILRDHVAKNVFYRSIQGSQPNAAHAGRLRLRSLINVTRGQYISNISTARHELESPDADPCAATRTRPESRSAIVTDAHRCQPRRFPQRHSVNCLRFYQCSHSPGPRSSSISRCGMSSERTALIARASASSTDPRRFDWRHSRRVARRARRPRAIKPLPSPWSQISHRALTPDSTRAYRASVFVVP